MIYMLLYLYIYSSHRLLNCKIDDSLKIRLKQIFNTKYHRLTASIILIYWIYTPGIYTYRSRFIRTMIT